MAQLVTRLEDDLVREIDRLVSDGIVASRSAAVRLALRDLVDHHRRRRIGLSIVDGYKRLPQTGAEVGFADEATRRMVAEETW